MLNHKRIKKFFKEKGYKVAYINFQINSVNGKILNKKDKSFFFKILKFEDYIKEIKGYITIKDIYPVNELVESFALEDRYIIVYNYDNTIKYNEGLLHDFFVDNDFSDNYKKEYKNILEIYERNLKNLQIRREYPM